MITVGKVNFIAKRTEPNPLEVTYWIDLSEDPNGSVIKCYDGKQWKSISGGNDDVYTKEETVTLISQGMEESQQIMQNYTNNLIENAHHVSSMAITEMRLVDEIPVVQEDGILYIKKV